jgi:tetratricopeptide (TPR) repeat protein
MGSRTTSIPGAERRNEISPFRAIWQGLSIKMVNVYRLSSSSRNLTNKAYLQPKRGNCDRRIDIAESCFGMKVIKQRRASARPFASRSIRLLAFLVCACPAAWPSMKSGAFIRASTAQSNPSAEAESELHAGIALTQQGRFSEAIPHLLAARGHVADEYAANFDLALCYAATDQFNQAIQILESLQAKGSSTVAVNNLLAQAYIGSSQPKKALAAFQEAVEQTPQDEKLYLLVADACMDHEAYDLGTEVLDEGLQHLPQSARLHYERGEFLTFQNQVDLAKADYAAAAKLAPGTDISYMALGQKDLLEGNIQGAVKITREGIRSGRENYILLTIFGDAVVRAGAAPNQPLFAEAQSALEKSVAERPNYADSQLELGELLLSAGRVDDAVAHLEKARQLAPKNPAVYSHLAIAYGRQGHSDEAQRMLAILAALNQQQTQKYKTDSPNKPGYVASGREIRKPSQ